MHASLVDIVPQTFLAKLPADLVRRVLEGGRHVELAPRSDIVRSSRKPGVAIVLDGLLRVYLTSADQRQVTVRYARPGDTLGLVHLFGGRLDVSTQAVTAASLWTVPSQQLRVEARACASLATAIAEECATLVADAVSEIALLTFGSVNQRVARHLLDLADARGAELVAAATQQELADATASVREVVARVLKAFDARGLTARSRAGIIILDSAGLDAEARGKPQKRGSGRRMPGR